MPVCPCEQVETLLGQGTLGLEMQTDAPDVDTVLIAVGGGGLIGGIAAWYGGRTKIVAVEPDGAAAFAALLSGRYKPQRDERVLVLICGSNTTAVSFRD